LESIRLVRRLFAKELGLKYGFAGSNPVLSALIGRKMTISPEKITVRIVSYMNTQITIEHDKCQVSVCNMDMTDASSIMKGIEITLNTLGYSLNQSDMYTDDSLMVGNFEKK